MSVREKGIHCLTALLLTEHLLGNVALAGYMANETDKISILRRPLICKFGAHKQYKEIRLHRSTLAGMVVILYFLTILTSWECQ